MFVENLILDNMFNNEQRENFENVNSIRGKNLILYVLNIVVAVVAGFLAWNCSKGEKPFLQVLYTVLAVIFSGIYLLFYLIYRVLLNNPCN